MKQNQANEPQSNRELLEIKRHIFETRGYYKKLEIWIGEPYIDKQINFLLANRIKLYDIYLNDLSLSDERKEVVLQTILNINNDFKKVIGI